jgi:hypothetical protein
VHRSALLDDALGEHRAALARLRAAEHWRRLVAARLDLAVATVTDIDDLGVELTGVPARALRGLLGVPDHDTCCDADLLAESGRLLELRKALGELDARVERMRVDSEQARRRLVAVMEADPASLWIRIDVPAA